VFGISSPLFRFGYGSALDAALEAPELELLEVLLLLVAVVVSEEDEFEVVLPEVEVEVEEGLTNVYAHSSPDSPYPVHLLHL
jgi:hypothetical protein